MTRIVQQHPNKSHISVITFPNCKINLGLHILRNRTDGYHDLETAFYPLPLKDALEIITNDTIKANTQFSYSGIKVEGIPNDNLCIKAYELLKKDFSLPFLQMHLHKTIPMRAGLGGGSADGAFTLKLLNQKFNLGLSTEKLIDYALQLGSDCPFFIINKPCYATGRGEFLEPIKLDFPAYRFVVVNPRINVSTAWAFSQLNLSATQKESAKLKQVIQQPIVNWKNELKNDFEEPVFKQYPEIRSIKEKLYGAGAIYALMSGSGSTVYGIFKKEVTPALSFPENYFVKELIS